MTLEEIKAAIDRGEKVHWSSEDYVVEKDRDRYLIICLQNGNAIGLTWMDGVTMNGKPEDFFTPEPEEPDHAVDEDGNKIHTFGPFYRSHITGDCIRRCTVPGCREYSLDGDDD